ncbi:hypothetical protein FOZ63_030410 [Perkinsus olseni]|uniref:Uncharacterized protein n=1 Tax=Perkinsus olseni TaxID=32597 RepID=A0A7J6RNM6_PEROL|nr:hypothetical protein FOZ63_030410 [Perkinsus olseni]KAF4731419.1 hypothetical protein FOZ62_028691 [Perkinsus olseni]
MEDLQPYASRGSGSDADSPPAAALVTHLFIDFFGGNGVACKEVIGDATYDCHLRPAPTTRPTKKKYYALFYTETEQWGDNLQLWQVQAMVKKRSVIIDQAVFETYSRYREQLDADLFD